MNKNIILPLTIALSAIAAGCSDDPEGTGKAPTFNEIELTPATCNPNDSVVATVTYKDKGSNYYFYHQYMTCNGSQIYINSSHTTSLPTNVKFAAPSKPGRYYVNFTSKISYTIGQTLFDVPEEKSAILTVVDPNEE